LENGAQGGTPWNYMEAPIRGPYLGPPGEKTQGEAKMKKGLGGPPQKLRRAFHTTGVFLGGEIKKEGEFWENPLRSVLKTLLGGPQSGDYPNENSGLKD